MKQNAYLQSSWRKRLLQFSPALQCEQTDYGKRAEEAEAERKRKERERVNEEGSLR